MKLPQHYIPWSIRFLDLWEFGDWKLKAYGITCDRAQIAQDLVEAARQVTKVRLAVSARGTNHYAVGFAGVHRGKTGNLVFVDWWADENELHHHVYLSPCERPAALSYISPGGLAACAWDLYVICHERGAWVDHVLKQGAAPDLEAYLNNRLEACL